MPIYYLCMSVHVCLYTCLHVYMYVHCPCTVHFCVLSMYCTLLCTVHVLYTLSYDVRLLMCSLLYWISCSQGKTFSMKFQMLVAHCIMDGTQKGQSPGSGGEIPQGSSPKTLSRSMSVGADKKEGGSRRNVDKMWTTSQPVKGPIEESKVYFPE